MLPVYVGKVGRSALSAEIDSDPGDHPRGEAPKWLAPEKATAPERLLRV